MSAHDRRDGTDHFYVTKYLVEFNPTHLVTLHQFQNLAFFLFGHQRAGM
jgi:hypothetical protein